jgi:hypothetical protein
MADVRISSAHRISHVIMYGHYYEVGRAAPEKFRLQKKDAPLTKWSRVSGRSSYVHHKYNALISNLKQIDTLFFLPDLDACWHAQILWSQ